MEQILQLFIIIPLVGFLGSLLFANKQERFIGAVVYSTLGLHLLGLTTFIAVWILKDTPLLDSKHFVFYKEGTIEIFLDFYFDVTTAVFAFLGALITLLVAIFSRFYLHREEGFKRFFNTVLFFFFGYNVAVFAGNFETLFIGWEFLGITSFLLIAFYRDRYLPVKNALKTLAMYRFGDICLMLVLWNSHHVWHENITFIKLEESTLVAQHIQEHYYGVLFIILMLITASSVKSAQIPFSSWLPRAMEGPTTSSAIFYGSLSVHLGVFLLIRTAPYWETIGLAKILIIIIGILTMVISSFISKVQATVKTQIAYSSIAQIGIMFIEIALGWYTLALIHLSGNALLRTYQLLVSPSVLGYLIHDQFFNYAPKVSNTKLTFMSKLKNTVYIWSVKEWNLDTLLKRVLWDPFKFLGNKLYFLSGKISIMVLFIFFLGGFLFFNIETSIPKRLDESIHLIFSIISLVLVMIAFVEKKNALKAWTLIIFSQCYCVLSISLLNDQYQYNEILYYASGLLLSAVIGIFSLKRLQLFEKKISLDDFYGHIYHHPKLGFTFLLACLAFVSLPFTPSFIGIDLIFTHIDQEEYLLIALTAFNFLILEMAVLRIYARLFLGPNKKQTHPIAYRSS